MEKSLRHSKKHVHEGFNFKCAHCEKIFTRDCYLNTHIKDVHKGVKHKCDSCDKSFSSTISLNRHAEIKHLKQKNYKCNVCNNHFTRSDLLKRHKLTHDQKRQRFQCQNCPMNFSREDYLKFHVRSVHLDVKFDCNICKERFPRPEYLKIHVQIKHLKAKYPCDECKMEFNWPGNLSRHISNVHSVISKFICNPCKRSFRDGYLLRKHKEKFHNMNTNLKTEPNHKKVASLIKTLRQKKFICKKCKREFKTPDDIKRHISKHPKNLANQDVNVEGKSDPEILIEDKTDQSEMYRGENAADIKKLENIHLSGNIKTIVKTKDQSDQELNDHQDNTKQEKSGDLKNVHEGIKPNKCNNFFETAKSQRRHSTSGVHKGVKYSCKSCDKTFTQGGNLKKHIRTVHESQNSEKIQDKSTIRCRYDCNLCTKSFNEKDNLIQHINIVHKGLKEYKCESCGKSFFEAAYLRRHIHTVHEGHKDHKCESCGKSFSQAPHLKKHINTIHKGQKDYKLKTHIKMVQVHKRNAHILTKNEPTSIKLDQGKTDDAKSAKSDLKRPFLDELFHDQASDSQDDSDRNEKYDTDQEDLHEIQKNANSEPKTLRITQIARIFVGLFWEVYCQEIVKKYFYLIIYRYKNQ